MSPNGEQIAIDVGGLRRGLETRRTETLNIPDSGVLFESGVHVVLSNIDRVTIFHS